MIQVEKLSKLLQEQQKQLQAMQTELAEAVRALIDLDFVCLCMHVESTFAHSRAPVQIKQETTLKQQVAQLKQVQQRLATELKAADDLVKRKEVELQQQQERLKAAQAAQTEAKKQYDENRKQLAAAEEELSRVQRELAQAQNELAAAQQAVSAALSQRPRNYAAIHAARGRVRIPRYSALFFV